MTQETEVLITEVVTAKVNGDEKFTAFDVSRVVQARQEEDGIEMERHRNMKHTIHDEMEQYVHNGLYEKSLADVGAKEHAFLYHPDGTDPTDYIPQHRAAAPPQPRTRNSGRPTLIPVDSNGKQIPPFSPAHIQNPPPVAFSGQVGTRGDARGTVAVPCNVVRSAGLVSGDTVYVSQEFHNGEQVLHLGGVIPQNPIATYTVDKYENVRITHPTLSAITNNGAGIDTFDFELDNNTIVVSKN